MWKSIVSDTYVLWCKIFPVPYIVILKALFIVSQAYEFLYEKGNNSFGSSEINCYFSLQETIGQLKNRVINFLDI